MVFARGSSRVYRMLYTVLHKILHRDCTMFSKVGVEALVRNKAL